MDVDPLGKLPSHLVSKVRSFACGEVKWTITEFNSKHRIFATAGACCRLLVDNIGLYFHLRPKQNYEDIDVNETTNFEYSLWVQCCGPWVNNLPFSRTPGNAFEVTAKVINKNCPLFSKVGYFPVNMTEMKVIDRLLRLNRDGNLNAPILCLPEYRELNEITIEIKAELFRLQQLPPDDVNAQIE